MEKNTMQTVKQRTATLLIQRTGAEVSSISLHCEVSGGRMCVLCNNSTNIETYSTELKQRFARFGIKFQKIEIQLN